MHSPEDMLYIVGVWWLLLSLLLSLWLSLLLLLLLFKPYEGGTLVSGLDPATPLSRKPPDLLYKMSLNPVNCCLFPVLEEFMSVLAKTLENWLHAHVWWLLSDHSDANNGLYWFWQFWVVLFCFFRRHKGEWAFSHLRVFFIFLFIKCFSQHIGTTPWHGVSLLCFLTCFPVLVGLSKQPPPTSFIA